jgi:hypothetical protein
MTPGPVSLCLSCRFVRTVHGRRGQQYLLCQNVAVPEKYPRQPVLACRGYERSGSPAKKPTTGPKEDT